MKLEQLARVRALGCALVLVLVGLEGQHEASSTVGGVVAGSSYPAGALLWPNHTGDAAPALTAWATAACRDISVRSWLFAYLAFGLVVLVGAIAVGLGLCRRWRMPLAWLVGVTAVLGVAQLVVATFAVADLPHGSTTSACVNGPGDQGGAMAKALFVMSIAVFIAIGLFVLCTLWLVATRPQLRAAVRRNAKGLAVQRFPAAVVALLAVLFLVPGAPVLEQAIDVQRSWVISATWKGVVSGVLAVIAFVLLSLAIRYLAGVHVAPFVVKPGADPEATVRTAVAKERLPLVVRHYQRQPPTDTSSRRRAWWLSFVAVLKQSWRWFAAVGAFVAAVVVLDVSGLAEIAVRTVVWVCLVLLAVPVVSAATALVRSPQTFDVYEEDARVASLKAGRAISIAVPIVLLVAMCRALVGPILLLSEQRTWALIVFVGSALAACLFVFWRCSKKGAGLRNPTDAPATTTKAQLDPQVVGARRPSTGASTVPGLARSVWLPASLALLCAVPLLLIPALVGRGLGVVAIIGVSLLTIVLFDAAVQIVSQMVDPPHIFRLLKLRRTPVTTLLLVIALGATFFIPASGLHDIRPPASAPTSGSRPTLEEAFDAWQASNHAGCAITTELGDGTKVDIQPMLFIAAEGGGIRAAWWTVKAMAAVVDTRCGRNAVFLTSGVSGGAIGLGIMTTNPNPVAGVEAIAGQDALAAASGAMLSRDLLAGSFGLNIRAFRGPSDDPYPDRAALMEQQWERQSTNFAAAFPSSARPVPWHTVFNATSVIKSCRVLIADVVLTDSTAGDCAATGNQIPGAYDLFNAQPCLFGLRTTTASLMAARFPYVTPSALVRGCGTNQVADQAIDGGYSENTGIDTATAAIQALLPQVRATNATAIAAAPTHPTVIVPMVVFLHNTVVASAGATLTPPPPRATPEIVVPPLNITDASQLGDPTTLLQRAATTAGQWAPAGTVIDQEALSGAVAAANLSVAMTIAPQQSPQMGLPLGWALSKATEGTLDDALDAYLTCTPSAAQTCAASENVQQLLSTWKLVS